MCRCFRTLLCAAVLLTCPLTLSAADLQLELVNGLRKQGFGDMGMHYLKTLEADKKIPASMSETFDLELARCMQVAAQHTENVDEADRLNLETRTQLDKFLKDHPTHAEAGAAFDTFGVLSLSIGNSSLKQALAQKDPKLKLKLLANAKTAFEESRPRFTEAVKLFQARYEALEQAFNSGGDEVVSRVPKARMSKARQETQLLMAEDDWLNSRFNLAMVDYRVAQTYDDLKHKEVKPLLEQAEVSLSSIARGYGNAVPGLLALYWTGRVNEQMGKLDNALDIYDEVTGSEPRGGEDMPPALLNFYGENYLRRLQLLNQLNRRDEFFFEDAEDWLKDNIGRKCDAYYGVVVELSKAYATEAATQPDAEKAKTMARVVRSLREIKGITSQYQDEAITLYNLHAKAGGEEVMEVKTFDEAMALGNGAMKNQEPKAAVEAFERAIVLKDQEKNPERLQFVQYQLALAKYQSHDLAGSFALADKFARDYPDTKLGPPAAVLAINASLFLYSSATPADRPATEKQLKGIVDYTIQKWPNHTEADDARIAQGRLKMVQGDLAGAIAALMALNPASDRFPQAQSLAAQNHRRLYQLAKQANKLDDAAKAHRTQAQDLFVKALAAASISLKTEDEPVATECRLNLGEMHLESEEWDQAIEMLTPVETKIRETNPPSLDNVQLRALLAAGRAYNAKQNLAAASACGHLLLDKGQDSPQVNNVLIGVTRLMRDDYQADWRKVLELTNMGVLETDAILIGAKAEADTSKAALLDILNKLAPRVQLSLPELVALGDYALDADLRDLAKSTYMRALAAGEKLPTKTPQTAAALTRVQAALIGLLRADRQFAEALVQVNALIATQPKALDPLVERARILQGMAEDDPAKWEEAQGAWDKLRKNLAGTPKKPPVFYEIVYNQGQCFAGQARNANAQNVADELKKNAIKLLKGTQALSPALSGPEMVAKYNALLEELSSQ